MLTILAFINKTEIGRVHIHNLGVINSKGEHKYEVVLLPEQWWVKSDISKGVIVWHKREDGWMKLTEKVLRKLRKKE